MVQINFALKEVNCKVVFYGPGMSGKTTNLEIVHQKAPEENKGELTSISTDGDRTLFFDFMPLDLGNVAGMRTKFQLYTVPGQVYYNATRKLVLQGADGVVFVADSQARQLDEDLESLQNLHQNVLEHGVDIRGLPLVLQYNKQDLPRELVLTPAELDDALNFRSLPSIAADALTGAGVFETLKAVSAEVLRKLSQGGSGRPNLDWPSHNGFLVCDPKTAWVVEASGRHWAARQVREFANISNHVSIGTDWDRLGTDVVTFAAAPGSG